MDAIGHLMKLAGTQLKELLEKVGITPEWYKQAKGKMGLDPTCNCEMWRTILDRTHLGWKESGWRGAKREYNKAREYYSQPR